MSSKPKTLSQSRIVETNSSGIVTIVIDDDSECTTNTNDISVSNSSNSAMFSPNRRPIGVQIPSTLCSPKFINTSDNCQNIMFKENKSNVILVNSSGSGGSASVGLNSGQLRSGQHCFTSQTPPTEVKSQHNVVTKRDTHLVVVNKQKEPTNITITTTSSSSCSGSSSSFSPKPSSPTKYRLWTQPSNQSLMRSPPISSTIRHRDKILSPEDVESDCMDDQTFFKYLNLIPLNKFKTKPKTQLNTEWPLRNVSRIPKPDMNSEGKLLLSNLKLTRNPIQTTPDLSNRFSEQKMRWYKEAQIYNEKLQHFKANLPSNVALREKLQSDLEALHKRLMSDKQKQNESEEKYRRLKSIEQSQKIQREEQKQELELYTNSFELTSLMGQRVMISSNVNPSLSPLEIFNNNLRIESHCKQRDFQSICVPQNTKLSTRITRSNTGFAGIDKMWGPRNESHEYCFTRRQRLEKYRRLETGLNWKSRLVAMQCKTIDVEVAKITRCPCCLQLVEPEWGHSCRDSDEESIQGDIDISSINDSDFGVQSEHNSNEDEVISSNSEVITAGNVMCFECGKEECNGTCVDLNETPVTQILLTDPLIQTPTQASTQTPSQTPSQTPIQTPIHTSTPIQASIQPPVLKQNPILVIPSTDALIPSVKPLIEDKIMVQRVPVLYDKSNKNILINSKRSDISIKRLNEQNLRISNEKNDYQNDSDDDIVVINEVRNDIQSHSSQRIATEPVIIRFQTSSDTKPSLKRKYSDNKPLSTYGSPDIIIVKKIK